MKVQHSEFWEEFQRAEQAAGIGQTDTAVFAIRRAWVKSQNTDQDTRNRRRDLANIFLNDVLGITPPADLFDLPAEPAKQAGAYSFADAKPLGPILLPGRPGVSLVTAAMNETGKLLRALPTWLALADISEIVILDWSSIVPVTSDLETAGIDDTRLRVIRAEGETERAAACWNAGLRIAMHDHILILSPGLPLREDFFESNKLKRSHFIIAGGECGHDSERLLLAHRSDLYAVHGFNEFLSQPGYENDDLSDRLIQQGLARMKAEPDQYLLQPSDGKPEAATEPTKAETAQDELQGLPGFHTVRNRYLSRLLPRWNRQWPVSPFDLGRDNSGREFLQRSDPQQNVVPPHIEYEATHHCLSELAARFISTDLRLLAPDALMRCLTQPLEVLVSGKADEIPRDRLLFTPEIGRLKGRFFIDAQYGLGNRLRAIGAAAAGAAASDRELVIIWEPDHHCEGRMADVFDYDGPVIDQALCPEDVAKFDRAYNYIDVEGGVKYAAISLAGDEDIYVRSAFALKFAKKGISKGETFLQSLPPTQAVSDLVRSVRTPNDVCVHIRMEGGTGRDQASYDSADRWINNDNSILNEWRDKSHYSNFIKRLQELSKQGRADRIFLAADLPETYDAFRQAFGDRVATLPRSLFDRSAAQMHYALADMILLGSAPLLLGSPYSSFTQLAQRLSPGPMDVEICSRDF